MPGPKSLRDLAARRIVRLCGTRGNVLNVTPSKVEVNGFRLPSELATLVMAEKARYEQEDTVMVSLDGADERINQAHLDYAALQGITTPANRKVFNEGLLRELMAMPDEQRVLCLRELVAFDLRQLGETPVTNFPAPEPSTPAEVSAAVADLSSIAYDGVPWEGGDGGTPPSSPPPSSPPSPSPSGGE
jgi:hypothetical protein